MSIFERISRTKLLPWLGAYLGAGFAALEGTTQLVENSLLPPVAYRIALVFYLFGIPGALVVTWFHGEKGDQRAPKSEIWILSFLLVAALVTSGYLLRNARSAAAARETALTTAAGGLDPRAVAVMYFDDLTSGSDLDYLADGFTESLIDQLSRVRLLDVVSANGVRPFRGITMARDSVARALSVGTLVTGTVERSRGDRILVSTNLVDGGSGATVDRMTVELPVSEVLSAQDSIAEQVSRALRTRIGEEVEVRERRSATEVPEAWSAVQRATRLQSSAEDLYNRGDLEGAIAAFESADEALGAAAEADATWSEPLTLRAHGAFRTARVMVSQDRLEEANGKIDQGIDYANQALQLAPNDARALEARGNLTYTRFVFELDPDPSNQDRLLEAARSDLEAATQSDPTLASAYGTLSHLYYFFGDNRVNSILAAQRAYEEDAYLRDADLILDRLFWANYDSEQFRDARSWCDEGNRRFPDDYKFAQCQLWLLLAPTVTPSVDQAWQLQARVDSIAPADVHQFEASQARMLVGGALARAGMADSANAVMEAARLSPLEDPTQELASVEAAIRSVTGDTETAMRLLQQYVASNPAHTFGTEGQLHWWWRNLEDEPGFQAVRGAGP